MSLSEKIIRYSDRHTPYVYVDDIREAVKELKGRSRNWSERGQFNEYYFENDLIEIFGKELT